MRKHLQTILPTLLLGCWWTCSQAQYPPLPQITLSRRADTLYMSNMAHLAKQRYFDLTRLPQTPKTDTLRFKTLYHLGRLYKWWGGRRDSTLYFGNELVREARKSQNLFYEVTGKLVLEEYYRTIDLTTPRALRLNFELLALIPQTDLYKDVRYLVNRNLGDLYSLSKDYDRALLYLNRAKSLLGTAFYRSATQTSFQIDVEQSIGSVYKRQNNFLESEAHYLAAEALLVNSLSEMEHAYVYDDLGELYLDYKRYDQALYYAKKAESIWKRVKPLGESNSWGTLACIHAGLGQDELALQYAQKILHIPRPSKFVREQAYLALYQLFEHRQDWQTGAFYFKKYIALRDTITTEQQSLELASIQKQAEFDRLTLQKQTEFDRFSLQNKQAQQLQAARLLNVVKQAELNRLRAGAQTDALTKKALLLEQQRVLENERAKTALTRQTARQKLQQQAFAQQGETERRARSWLLTGLIGVLLFTLALSIVYQKNRSQKRQITLLNAGLEQTVQTRTAELLSANDELLRKNQVLKEADARIIAAQETERQRIAADLHDDLGGTLATLRRKIADGRQRFPQPDVRTTFDDLEPLIQKGSDDLRRIAHHLMPPEFARIGLRAALEQLVRAIPQQPTRVEFLASGPDRKLPVDIELNLYRIASELVQNILKHASAKRASVQLLYHEDHLCLLVEDDGVGISGQKLLRPNGIGLKNSNFRADYIGATLLRETSEGGTLFVLELPGPEWLNSVDHATHPTG